MVESKILFCGFLFALCPPALSYGYEVSTHAALTREAYLRSALQNTDLIQRLGISSYQKDFGNIYFDIVNYPVHGSFAPVYVRQNNPSENGSEIGDENFTYKKFELANELFVGDEISFSSTPGWMMVGAIREDDVKYDRGARENPPQDETGATFPRVLNHFYDPYYDSPLNWRPGADRISLGSKAYIWAIEGAAGGVLVGRANNFSIYTAREAMFRAATLRAVENGALKTLSIPTIGTGVVTGPINFTGEAMRKAYWATVFRSLGDAVHTLQDMGQPQHTRNDSHAGMLCTVRDNNCYGGHASFYEKYLEARVTGSEAFTLTTRYFAAPTDNNVQPSSKLGAPTYTGYNVVRFNNYKDYFSTDSGEASYSGKGLSNYSNMGFFTAGTNLGSSENEYPLPPRTLTSFDIDLKAPGQIVSIDGNAIGNNDAALLLLTHDVKDNLTGTSAQNIPLSTLSAFDQFLERDEWGYSLNHYNYNEMADLLLPRAVAYGAGLIDYFFRGQMEISMPSEGVYGLLDHGQFSPPAPPVDPLNDSRGFDKIKLRLKNTTEAIQATDGNIYPQEMSNGILVAVIKFYRNPNYTADLDNEMSWTSTLDEYLQIRKNLAEHIVVSKPLSLTSLAPEETIELAFDFSEQPLPINAWPDVRLSVVFRGQLGSEEDAVVVSEKEIGYPFYFAYHNSSDLVRVEDFCYTAEEVEASDELWGKIPASCRGAGRKLQGSCAAEDMDISISMGRGLLRPIYMSWHLPASRFARFAFLRDRTITDDPDELKLTTTIESPSTPFTSAPGSFYPETIASWPRIGDKNHRGVHFLYARSLVSSGDGYTFDRVSIVTKSNGNTVNPDLASVVFKSNGSIVNSDVLSMITKGDGDTSDSETERKSVCHLGASEASLLQGQNRYPVPVTTFSGW